MFYSETLLSKDGPLAQVWLAANLERKLNKTQFLQSNIIQSTQAIVKATSSSSSTSPSQDDSEALALRLSGQLLYGVVRIYSRKAKYLLDDVSDALMKLKTAFKSSAQSVTLPIKDTVVPSVTQLMLADTITHVDLLYQEPLVFDEDSTTSTTTNGVGAGFFGLTQAERSDLDFDDSIEIPRNKFNDLDELQIDDGFDLDLNFDIDAEEEDKVPAEADESIEMGRAIEQDFNLSAIDNIGEDLQQENEEEHYDDIDLGDFGDFGNLGEDEDRVFDQPLELIDEPTNEELEKDKETTIVQPKTRAPRQPKVSTAGQRKIVVDRTIEIPVSDFSDTGSIVVQDNEISIKKLDLNSKRSYIQSLLRENFNFSDIYSLSPSKRQKTVVSTNDLDLDMPDLVHSDLDHSYQFEEEDRYDDIDLGEDNDRVSYPDQTSALYEEEEEDNFIAGNSKDGISDSTLQISRHIQTITTGINKTTTFTEILDTDIKSSTPLSSNNKPRSEATRVFFELLVLGTNDAIKLNQEVLFGEINVQSRENLFQRFV